MATEFREFWGDIQDNYPLKQVVRRIINILPHSASCERLFSRMAYIKKSGKAKCQRKHYRPMHKLKLKREYKDIIKKTKKIFEEDYARELEQVTSISQG